MRSIALILAKYQTLCYQNYHCNNQSLKWCTTYIANETLENVLFMMNVQNWISNIEVKKLLVVIEGPDFKF